MRVFQSLALGLSFLMFASVSQSASLSELDQKVHVKQTLDSQVWEKVAHSEDQKTRGQLLNFCLRDEEDFTGLSKEVFAPLETALGSAAKSSKSETLTPIEETNLFKKYTSADFALTSASQAKKLVETLSAGFASVKYARLAPHKIVSRTGSRDKASLSMFAANVLTRYEIFGLDKKTGQRRVDRGNLEVGVVKTNGKWSVGEVSANTRETLVSKREPTFKEVAFNSTTAQIPVYLREEAIRRGGYAVSVADYDENGTQDIVLGTAQGTFTYSGDGKGSFVYKKTPLESETLVKTAIAANFGGGTHDDLVMVRFEPGDSGHTSDIVYYKNMGAGKYEKQNLSFQGRNKTDKAMPSTVADFDRDGYLDLYVGFPGARDFTYLENKKTAPGLNVHGLFKNVKGKSFQDVTATKLKGSIALDGWVAPHGAMAFDYNQDGLMDLFVVDDRGNLSQMFKNQGNFTLSEDNYNSQIVNLDLGMGIAGGDLDGDGIFDFAMTNVNYLAAERLHTSCGANWMFASRRIGVDGLKIFKGKKDGSYADVSQVFTLSDPGEGLAGVEFLDYNNDGLLDIVVSNGLWSGTDNANDISSLFVRDLFSGSKAAIDSMYENLQFPGSVYQNVLRSETYGPKKDQRLSMAGHQAKRLYLNEGEGKFTEVGYLEGLDSMADGYVVATADVNKDGQMDVVFRNADPGTKEVSFSPLQVFLNEGKDAKKSVILSLKGTKSNVNGIGAIVKAFDAGGKQIMVRHLIANNSSAQSQKIVHMGLGDRTSFDTVEIAWPSGTKQLLKNVGPGYREVQEGSSTLLGSN